MFISIYVGYKVRAYYLKIWLEDEISHLNNCPWEEDLFYATQVCNQLNVTLEIISLQKEYWSEVVQYTLNESIKGRTPNPDIMCNSRIKFGIFYDYIGR
jgi:tRNA-specific 2-thiouridylase